MAYFLNLFSPETYEIFSKSDKSISGFRMRQQNAARKIHAGDKLICYMTNLSRWIGVLEVLGDSFKDATPLYFESDDPFIIRFQVKPLAWLSKEKSVPMRDERIWRKLSFTRAYDLNYPYWTGKFRNSLNQLDDEDGEFLEDFIFSQARNGEIFEVDEEEYQKLLAHTVRRTDKTVRVSVPQDSDVASEVLSSSETRESTKIQALLANIGSQMGMKIWIPKNDRTRVIAEWKSNEKPLVETLPLNYDETTLRTIEQIDVLWLRGRSIVRAFEVEHATSVYSGILRMEDLLALQPNMDINLHIVAPNERREKVFHELTRPVFSLLEKGPLSEYCTYLSYDSVRELAQERYLSHLSDSVLDEYAEPAEDAV